MGFPLNPNAAGGNAPGASRAISAASQPQAVVPTGVPGAAPGGAPGGAPQFGTGTVAEHLTNAYDAFVSGQGKPEDIQAVVQFFLALRGIITSLPQQVSGGAPAAPGAGPVAPGPGPSPAFPGLTAGAGQSAPVPRR
jgi:hypothetical protein